MNPAIANMDGPLAAFGDRRVVRHDQDSRAQALMQIVNQFQNLEAGGRIQIARRFVGQQNRRIDAQRAGDGHTLPLASR